MRGRMAGMEEHLRRLVELQSRQNELLERYLWRIRFSLLTLLLLTTALCCRLGYVAYKLRVPTPYAPAISPYYAVPAPVVPFATPGTAPTVTQAPNRPMTPIEAELIGAGYRRLHPPKMPNDTTLEQ
jgi:hypothetical protein